MTDKIKFKIIIINSSDTFEKIDWLFKTIKDITVQNFLIDDLKKRGIDSSNNVILIFYLTDINEKLLNFLLEFSEKLINDNVFILVEEKISKHLTNLIRLGFNKFYLFPEEEFILRNDIVEHIEKIKNKLNFETNLEKVHRKYSFENLIGKSPSFLDCIEIAKKVAAKSDATVLLLGETGTGKELLAKAIHYNSDRSEFPFIELNTSAINENLFESELFGYEKGAFTDAKTSKPGLLEIAERGTTFLDEIGDLNLNLQVKLLRAIENKTIKRVGGIKDIKINCRIIAATNQNLEKLIDEKKFRLDLYYRLKVISIYLPPLRERSEDIIPLTEHFIRLYNHKYEKKVEGISQNAKQLLLQYNWPGNIRELSNVIERAVLLADTKFISEKDIFLGFSPQTSISQKKLIELKFNLDTSNIHNAVHKLAQEVLNQVGGNKSEAAKILGISRPKLLKILKGKK